MLAKSYQMNNFLSRWNPRIKNRFLGRCRDLGEFDKLEPYLEWLHAELGDFQNSDMISFTDVRYRLNQFLVIMDNIVDLFQKKSESEIKTMMVIEL